jgi:uncharacterized protein YbdZ (MbtH family)
MRKAADTRATESRKAFVLRWQVASWYAFSGDRDRCLEWLERAYVDRDPNLPYVWLPRFDFVHSGHSEQYGSLFRNVILVPDGVWSEV